MAKSYINENLVVEFALGFDLQIVNSGVSVISSIFRIPGGWWGLGWLVGWKI